MNIVLYYLWTFALLLSMKNLLYIIWRLHFDLHTLMRQNFCTISFRGKHIEKKYNTDFVFLIFYWSNVFNLISCFHSFEGKHDMLVALNSEMYHRLLSGSRLKKHCPVISAMCTDVHAMEESMYNDDDGCVGMSSYTVGSCSLSS